MRNQFKKKEKQLKQLLENDFDFISIDLIQRSKVKDEDYNIGDIVSSNEHFLKDMFRILNQSKDKKWMGFGSGFIDGWEIPFKDYEMKLINWFGDDRDRILFLWEKTEKQIGEILGLKIYNHKTNNVFNE